MEINYNLLKMDNEGEYSLSHKIDADNLSKIIKNKFGDIIIMDATAGLGGNSISFGIYFKKVISIEVNLDRFKLLEYNINLFKLNNKLINDTFINYIYELNYDVIFIDPPWGGPNYKNYKSLRLSICNKTLLEITSILKSLNKYIIWKLQFNYDINEFSNFNYEIYNIKNYLILVL